MATMAIPASEKVFRDEDVAKMVEGVYWSDSDEDEEESFQIDPIMGSKSNEPIGIDHLLSLNQFE